MRLPGCGWNQVHPADGSWGPKLTAIELPKRYQALQANEQTNAHILPLRQEGQPTAIADASEGGAMVEAKSWSSFDTPEEMVDFIMH
jgi:hypothetical protein